VVNSVLIGVNATSVGRMRDREPACRAGRESPILGWVWTRDCCALLYSIVVRPCFCSGGLPVRAWMVQATASSLRSYVAPASGGAW